MPTTSENEMKSTASQIAVLIEQMRALRIDVTGIKAQIDRNDQASQERHKDLQNKIDNHYVTQIEYQENKKIIDGRIRELEDARSWIIKLILGLIITGIISYFMIFEK